MSKVQKSYNKKQHYNKSNQRRLNVEVNLKGFLCSCNNREKDCVRESYNILNKYADILWPAVPAEASTETNSIEDDLQKELKELRAEKRDTKRFQLVDSGAKNFLFIKTTVEDPLKLAESILQDIFEKKSQESRFLLRLIPIETTCKAYINDIEKAFEPLCEKHFSTQPKTFSIVFNHRNNNSVSREEVIKIIADNIAKYGQSKGVEHKVDLKNAEVAVIIEVIRGFAFLGVVSNFFKYKKYNLMAFAGEPEAGGSTEDNVVVISEDVNDNKDDTED